MASDWSVVRTSWTIVFALASLVVCTVGQGSPTSQTLAQTSPAGGGQGGGGGGGPPMYTQAQLDQLGFDQYMHLVDVTIFNMTMMGWFIPSGSMGTVLRDEFNSQVASFTLGQCSVNFAGCGLVNASISQAPSSSMTPIIDESDVQYLSLNETASGDLLLRIYIRINNASLLLNPNSSFIPQNFIAQGFTFSTETILTQLGVNITSVVSVQRPTSPPTSPPTTQAATTAASAGTGPTQASSAMATMTVATAPATSAAMTSMVSMSAGVVTQTSNQNSMTSGSMSGSMTPVVSSQGATPQSGSQAMLTPTSPSGPPQTSGAPPDMNEAFMNALRVTLSGINISEFVSKKQSFQRAIAFSIGAFCIDNATLCGFTETPPEPDFFFPPTTVMILDQREAGANIEILMVISYPQPGGNNVTRANTSDNQFLLQSLVQASLADPLTIEDIKNLTGIRIAQVASAGTLPPTTDPTDSSGGSDSSTGLSTGALVGIIVGALLVIVVVVVVVYFVKFKGGSMSIRSAKVAPASNDQVRLVAVESGKNSSPTAVA